MESLITAAARALETRDSLGVNRVSLRDDAPALALRGIAMAQHRPERDPMSASSGLCQIRLKRRVSTESASRRGSRLSELGSSESGACHMRT